MAEEQAVSKFDVIYANDTLNELVICMNDQQRRKEELEAMLKATNSEYDYLRLVAIPNKMESEGVTNLTLEGIGRVGLTSDAYASVKAGMRDQAWEWLRDTGHGDLITETINSSTLKAALKQMVLKGEEVPEEFFNFTPFTRASITRKGVTSDS